MINSMNKNSHCLKTAKGDISYFLVRSRRRRTIAIQIDPKTQIKVFAPNFVAQKEVNDFIYQKTDWILSKIQEFQKQLALKKSRRFEDGEKFLFLGKEHRLLTEASYRKTVKLMFNGNEWMAKVPLSLTEEKQHKAIKEQMNKWYRLQACEILGSRVFHYCRIMDLEPLKISVKTQKRIWGSCHHSKKSIYLNWRIIMTPMEVVDYIIVHELSHLNVPSHSKRFWNEVQKVLPDYKNREKWLRKNSCRMELDGE